VFCDVGRPVLWLPALSVVDGIWWMSECSGHREKKNKKRCLRYFGLLKSYSVALYCFCCCCFCIGRRFLSSPASSDGLRRCSGESPASLQLLFCYVFSNVLLLFLGTASLFYVFSASVKAPTKLCIFRRVSGDAPAKFSVAVPFWISARCRPSWISARCRPLLDFGLLSALLDFGPLLASFGFRPIVGLFWISARCWPLLDFGRLLAPFGVWPIVGPFKFAFSSHLPSSLATHQPLSSLAASTIYGPFPASTTAVIIISDFKLKVAEYFTLSLRGDVRIEYFIYYSLHLLSFLLGFISYLN
jgi:hypothetical protein